MLRIEIRIDQHFAEERIVDLQREPGIDDRLVLGAQRRADGVEVFFLALVVVVETNTAWRDGRHERIFNAGRGERRLEIVDVALQRLEVAIADWTGAHQRHERQDRAAEHRILEVLRVVLRECRGLCLEEAELAPRLRLEADHALAHVGKKARLGLLAVGDDIDAAVLLLLYDVHHRLADAFFIGIVVDALAGELGLHQVEKIVRARQAADVGGQDAVGHA